MSVSVDLDPDLYERLDNHCDEGESVEDLIEELLNTYESEGRFLTEGFSE